MCAFDCQTLPETTPETPYLAWLLQNFLFMRLFRQQQLQGAETYVRTLSAKKRVSSQAAILINKAVAVVA